MKMCSHRLGRFLFRFTFAIVVLVDNAMACTCLFGGPAPCQEYWNTDVVFTGTPTKSARVNLSEEDHKYEKRLIRFSVTETFRGDQASEVEVITGLGGSDCGYDFRLGEVYLVYARRGEKDQRLDTGICSRTRLLAQANEDLAYIRGLSVAESSAMIFGRVTKRNYRQKEGEDFLKPASSVVLVVEGEATRTEVRTDAQGDYRATGLEPGSYKIRLRVPKGLANERMSEDSTLQETAEVVERGCAEVSFSLESDTRISGRVIDATGQPVGNMPLRLRGAPSDEPTINTFLHARTNGQGSFEFKTVPPGDYLLGIRILEGSSSAEDRPYPRTYYPGVGLKGQASLISVKAGDHLQALELRLLPRLVEYNVGGFVVWSDGRPAPGVMINLSLLEEGDLSDVETFRADERGRFTLKAYESLKYRVSAYPQGARGPEPQSQWVEVPQTRDDVPIKLILPILKK
jgi:hypothetical protein